MLSRLRRPELTIHDLPDDMHEIEAGCFALEPLHVCGRSVRNSTMVLTVNSNNHLSTFKVSVGLSAAFGGENVQWSKLGAWFYSSPFIIPHSKAESPWD